MAKPATATKPSAPSFGALLNTPPSETERPKPLPQGSYTAMVQGLPRMDKSAKKQTEFVEFTLKLLSANEDVDEEELAAMGGLADKTIKDTYYLTDNSLWRLKDFLINCGIDVDNAESYSVALEETPGKQIGVFIKHEASQDGTSVFARVGKTFVVE
jgi:hypothetical protein